MGNEELKNISIDITNDDKSDGDEDFTPDMHQHKNQEFHTSISFDSQGQIMIFSNFFFVKKVLKLVGNLSEDMNKKRQLLISNVRDSAVVENIKKGYDYLKDLNEITYKQLQELRTQNLLK